MDRSPKIIAQRRKHLAQDEAWIASFLNRASIGHVATRWENQPHITPTNFWYDATRHVIYFHSNIVGQIRKNAEHFPEVCFEASEHGRLLPSNVALEFSIQYESVIAFGKMRVVEDNEEKRYALYGLIAKYFPETKPGVHYRPITDQELKRTSVYAIQIESWSGKRNWKERAEQSDEWSPLAEEWFTK